jgi:mono/diheme cytochrome c family protein
MRLGLSFLIFLALMALLACLMAGCARAPEPVAAVALATPVAAPVAAPVGDPVEGLRVATRVGCNGCHDKDGSGSELWEDKGKYHLYSPNLTEKRELYDDAGLKAFLREGRTHDGHVVLGMPIVMFQHLSDREIRDITAWLRSLPAVADGEKESTWISPEVAKQLQAGTFQDAIDWGAHAGVSGPEAPPTDTLALGKHLAMTTCVECHGPTLDGWSREEEEPPPLIVAKAYSAANFMRLMRTGITAAGTKSKSGLMSAVGKGRASAMTDDEVRALKYYLDSR